MGLDALNVSQPTRRTLRDALKKCLELANNHVDAIEHESELLVVEYLIDCLDGKGEITVRNQTMVVKPSGG